MAAAVMREPSPKCRLFAVCGSSADSGRRRCEEIPLISSGLIGAPTPLSEERTCRVTWTRSHAVSAKNHSFSLGDQLMKEAGLGSPERVLPPVAACAALTAVRKKRKERKQHSCSMCQTVRPSPTSNWNFIFMPRSISHPWWRDTVSRRTIKQRATEHVVHFEAFVSLKHKEMFVLEMRR